MMSVLASWLLGAILLSAAGLKVADRAGSVVALATYGLDGRAARSAWAALVVAEAALGAALAFGVPGAAAGAAVMLLAFATAQGAALLAGRSGAPCGCAGGRGRLSGRSVARTAALASVAAALAVAGVDPPPAAGAAALVAAAAAVAAMRARRPEGALDVAGEGPAIGEPAPFDVAGPGLVLFTSGGCRLCARLRPALSQLGGVELDEDRDAEAWLAARVPGSPYAVVLDAAGTVRAKGTVNTARQLESLLPARPDAQSRRGFLGRLAGAAAAITAGRTVGALVAPGDAEAYHFCGHIYTTDGCPHPTGLPRIDSRGFALRARDGAPVDDLGRLIDGEGRPIDEDGSALVDTDGRPLPPATRTRLCDAVAAGFGISTRVDGSWYRCCGGRVRKLVDCCTPERRRINGDRALRGYCYGKRKVFCVMYFQTRVPC